MYLKCVWVNVSVCVFIYFMIYEAKTEILCAIEPIYSAIVCESTVQRITMLAAPFNRCSLTINLFYKRDMKTLTVFLF